MNKPKFPAPHPKPFPEWATYCPRRHPAFKIYTNKGHATNAVSYRMPNEAIQLLHWNKDTNEWDIEIDFVPPDRCEECNNVFEKYYDKHQFTYGGNTPKYLTPVICRNCYDRHYKEWRATLK